MGAKTEAVPLGEDRNAKARSHSLKLAGARNANKACNTENACNADKEGFQISSETPFLMDFRAREFLQAFCDGADVPFFIKDESLRYVWVNAKFGETFPGHAAEIIGKTESEWRQESAPASSQAEEELVLKNERASTSTLNLEVADGSVRTFKIQRFPITDENGRLFLGGIAFDINVEVKTEAHLREKGDLLELILNNIGDPVIAVDEKGALLLFNPAAIKLHGLDNARGKYGLFMPDRVTRYEQADLPLARAIKGEEVHDLEIFVRTPYDSEGLTVSASAQPLKDKEGKLRGGAAVLRDITLRKKVEEALLNARDEALAASELKSQFVSSISHELRTPMSGVLGMTELLMEMGLTPEQKEMAQYIYESAQGLLKVVNDLLDFSRLEAGKLQMEKSTIDVRSLVEECATAHWDAAARKQLHLSYEVAEDMPKQLLGDDLRTRQILSNLIANAVKFTDKGHIKVSAAATRSFPGGLVVRFTVSDSGIGVPANQQERLFEPFVQADGSNTRKYGGVGLGLSICRRLVKLMAGDIGVASKEEEGSDFWFEIPLEAVSKTNGREENDSRS